MRDESPTSQEYQLLEYVERLERSKEGRRAVLIRLSRVMPAAARGQYLRPAISLFERSTRAVEGQLFQLAGDDFCFVYRDTVPAELEQALRKLIALFDADPMAPVAERPDAADLVCHFDLTTDYAALKSLARSLYDEAQIRQRGRGSLPPESEKQPIGAHRLGDVVDKLAAADVSRFMRRQPVCAVIGGQPPQVLFNELFISIADLRDFLVPQYDLAASRWLFQYLTATLDRRMLALLGKNDDPAIASAFSINLNVATILSPDFLAFDAKLKQTVRGTIVVEMQLIDVYADLSAFAFARDFLRGCGYRTCLDGLNIHTLPFVDRERLGFDLVKLQSSRNLYEGATDASRGRWRELVERMGRSRLILCHVDNEDAVAFGNAVGIAMFQGRHIDKIAAARRA